MTRRAPVKRHARGANYPIGSRGAIVPDVGDWSARHRGGGGPNGSLTTEPDGRSRDMSAESAKPGILDEPRSPRQDSLDRLLPVVYEELREIAHRHLAEHGHAGSLATTGLVHEVYLKLVDQSRMEWRDRAHFFAFSAVAMRHILVDRARARAALKRGGVRRPVTLDEETIPVDDCAEVLLAIDDALDRLAAVEPRLAKVVECRFFGGLSEKEIAQALGISERSVERDWAKARMLLRRALAV